MNVVSLSFSGSNVYFKILFSALQGQVIVGSNPYSASGICTCLHQRKYKVCILRSYHSEPSERVPRIEILVLERVYLHWSSKRFWQKNLVKILLISTLDKVICYKGTFLQRSTKPLFTYNKK
jgi:hypothetical protein